MFFIVLFMLDKSLIMWLVIKHGESVNHAE